MCKERQEGVFIVAFFCLRMGLKDVCYAAQLVATAG